MVGAWNSTWGGATRLDPGVDSDDPLLGWRVAVTRLLHPFEAPAEDGPFKELQKRWNNRDMDISFCSPYTASVSSVPMDTGATCRPNGLKARCTKCSAPATARWIRCGWDSLSMVMRSRISVFTSCKVFTDADYELLAYALRAASNGFTASSCSPAAR